MAKVLLLLKLLLLLLLTSARREIAAAAIGVCYGTLGRNLPPARDVVQMFKHKNITRVRIYDPNQEALAALANSGIELTVGVPNSALDYIASGEPNAASWLRANIANYTRTVDFRYIAVGNEALSPSSPSAAAGAKLLLRAMRNMDRAISKLGLANRTKVTTAVQMAVLATSFPPSAAAFHEAIRGVFDQVVDFLAAREAPLLANVYPYFAYAGDSRNIRIDYALCNASSAVVADGDREYSCLLDAMVDALRWAVEKAGGGGAVDVVVSESGWPSAGGTAATPENAALYYRSLFRLVGGGSRRKGLEAYAFSMFDEDRKMPELEKHWGLFSPNKSQKYAINFTEGVNKRVRIRAGAPAFSPRSSPPSKAAAPTVSSLPGRRIPAFSTVSGGDRRKSTFIWGSMSLTPLLVFFFRILDA